MSKSSPQLSCNFPSFGFNNNNQAYDIGGLTLLNLTGDFKNAQVEADFVDEVVDPAERAACLAEAARKQRVQVQEKALTNGELVVIENGHGLVTPDELEELDEILAGQDLYRIEKSGEYIPGQAKYHLSDTEWVMVAPVIEEPVQAATRVTRKDDRTLVPA